MIYLSLFWSFFQIGLLSIGGGYAAMPLIQEQVVELHGWLTPGGFGDLVTVSQMTPGPIALNASTFVGIQVAGFPGALVATLGCITPSCVIVLLLAKLYVRYRDLSLLQGILGGLRPAVVALIASAGLSIIVLSLWGGAGFSWGLEHLRVLPLCLFAASLALLRLKKPNPIWVMLGAGAVAGVLQAAGLW